MILVAKAKLAYIAMPKTGSSALETAMIWHADIACRNTPILSHMTVGTFEHFIRPYLDAAGIEGIETCCQIRHPIDWLASWWRYLSDPAVRPDHMDTSGISFEEYARAYLDTPDAPAVAIGRQLSMIRDDRGNDLVDHIFRYEDMPAFIRFLESRIGEGLKVKRFNTSPSRNATLSPQMRLRLEAFFEPELEIHRKAGLRA